MLDTTLNTAFDDTVVNVVDSALFLAVVLEDRHEYGDDKWLDQIGNGIICGCW